MQRQSHQKKYQCNAQGEEGIIRGCCPAHHWTVTPAHLPDDPAGVSHTRVRKKRLLTICQIYRVFPLLNTVFYSGFMTRADADFICQKVPWDNQVPENQIPHIFRKMDLRIVFQGKNTLGCILKHNIYDPPLGSDYITTQGLEPE
jgi:hypothetical protein